MSRRVKVEWRPGEARAEFVRAAGLAGNEREKTFLMERANSLARNGADAAG